MLLYCVNSCIIFMRRTLKRSWKFCSRRTSTCLLSGSTFTPSSQPLFIGVNSLLLDISHNSVLVRILWHAEFHSNIGFLIFLVVCRFWFCLAVNMSCIIITSSSVCCVLLSVAHVTVLRSLAQSQQYDQDGIVDIFRQYGDHLYRYLLLAPAVISVRWKFKKRSCILLHWWNCLLLTDQS